MTKINSNANTAAPNAQSTAHTCEAASDAELASVTGGDGIELDTSAQPELTFAPRFENLQPALRIQPALQLQPRLLLKPETFRVLNAGVGNPLVFDSGSAGGGGGTDVTNCGVCSGRA